MESSSTLRFMFLSFLFLASAAFSGAHIGDFDSYWQKRAEEANHYARGSYSPDPVSVTRQFNQLVGEDLKNHQKKGRSLRGTNRISGLCQATNPIDRCWRCRSDWADLRKQLAECAQGFGRHAGGGKAGEFYVVTDASDSDVVNPKPGTLRFGVVQDRPLWIVFARDMVIRLAEELIVTSNKTIDGRGADVRIAGGPGIKLQFVNNVILHGIHIHDIKAGNGGMVRDSESHVGLRTRSDGDGISIFGSSNIWIDHVSVANCTDGLIDAVQSSTAITISNCHLTQHNDAMLFGESDSYSGDAITQITVAFNHFGAGLVQRMPRCRWGFCHIVNNDHTHWTMDAVGGSKHPTILSQGNRYTAPAIHFAKEAAGEERNHATESENGASSAETGSPELKQEFSSKEHEMIGNYVSRLTRFAGALDCVANQQC